MSKTKQLNNSKVQKPRRRALNVVPVVQTGAPKCARVGDKVCYPPFLMQWDAKKEGEFAVRERTRRK